MTDGTPDAALGLERLRGELREGLARIEGALALLVQRSDQSEKAQAGAVARLDKHEGRLDALEAHCQASSDHEPRLKALEHKVWAAAGGAATLGGALGLAAHIFHF